MDVRATRVVEQHGMRVDAQGTRAPATPTADDAYRVREAADQLVYRDRRARGRALGVIPAEDKIVIRQELRVVVDVVDRELDSGMDLQTTSP